MIQQHNILIPDYFIENIYKLQSGYKPLTLRTNVGGWQSKQYKSFENILWAKECFDNCIDTTNLKNKLKYLWFNINPAGASHRWHYHGMRETVGVLYIQVPENSGNIEFKGKLTQVITPVAGTLLTFPGNLEHRVLENLSANDRISMAFNLEPLT